MSWCVRGTVGGEAAFLWWGRGELSYQSCAVLPLKNLLNGVLVKDILNVNQGIIVLSRIT